MERPLDESQGILLNDEDRSFSSPLGSQRPTRPKHFHVQRIYLAKGSTTSPDRKAFAEKICALYPHAEIIDCPNTAHNRIDLGESDPLRLHRMGKRTLVFGDLGDAVRFSEEEGNTCPNYWHFSPCGFCPYGCKYCYLAGTRGVWYSPTVKIFVNIDQIIEKINQTANRLAEPTAFHLGKLQDALALDPLTAYSTVLVPFFARHEFARQVILTKSAEVDRLLDLHHNGHTILSWSLLPPEVSLRFEGNVPSVEDRIGSMQRCAARGYPIRAVIMPIILVDDWEAIYARFLRRLLTSVPLQRLTLGGICIYRSARNLMERKLGTDNEVSRHIDKEAVAGDGRVRYPRRLRTMAYDHLMRVALDIRRDLEVALCLEENEVWQELGISERLGRCNCVL